MTIAIITFVVVWVLIISYFILNTNQYRKSTEAYYKSSDFYIRSTTLSTLGDIKGAKELIEIGEAYSKEGDRLGAIAKKWDFTKRK